MNQMIIKEADDKRTVAQILFPPMNYIPIPTKDSNVVDHDGNFYIVVAEPVFAYLLSGGCNIIIYVKRLVSNS